MFSLILVDYNSLPKTLQYVERCTEAFGPKGVCHIIIIQNGDSSKDLPMLEETFGEGASFVCRTVNREIFVFHSDGREILYCASGENLGYGRGNNLGAKIADEVWRDAYYIISNNDLEFPQGFDLQIVADLFETHPKIGAIGSQIVTPEGIQQSPRRFESAPKRLIRFYWLPLLYRPFGQAAVERANARIFNDTTGENVSGKCDWVSGCLTFLRANAFWQAGMYDEHTFLYGEEMMLSKRLEKAGFSVYHCADLLAIHAHGATTKKSIDPFAMTRLDFSSIYYYYENYTNTSKLMLLTAKLCFWLLMTIFRTNTKIKAILKKGN